MKITITLHVNGQSREVQAHPDTPLLYVLRNNLELNGPKFGCGMQQCGACMALLDGKAQTTCMLPVSAAAKSKIITLDGLAENGRLHAVQQAFDDEQAAQCGYCINSMVISAVSLLNEHPAPDDEQIIRGMQRALCRCGSQARMIRAVRSIASQKSNLK